MEVTMRCATDMPVAMRGITSCLLVMAQLRLPPAHQRNAPAQTIYPLGVQVANGVQHVIDHELSLNLPNLELYRSKFAFTGLAG
jgi:hypothetical protein